MELVEAFTATAREEGKEYGRMTIFTSLNRELMLPGR